MTTATVASPTEREPKLVGQTVVLIGGSAGIGLETARLARAEGADGILTGRDPDRRQHAASDLGALADMDFDEARRAIEEHPMLMLGVARYAAGKARPGGAARRNETKALGLYRAESETELNGLMRALPLYEWMVVTVTPLAPHPNDPASRQP